MVVQSSAANHQPSGGANAMSTNQYAVQITESFGTASKAIRVEGPFDSYQHARDYVDAEVKPGCEVQVHKLVPVHAAD